jgi:hypothetical protein
MNAIPFVLLLAFWIFMMRQMQSGGNKALSFGTGDPATPTGAWGKITSKRSSSCFRNTGSPYGSGVIGRFFAQAMKSFGRAVSDRQAGLPRSRMLRLSFGSLRRNSATRESTAGVITSL